jgi:hypothetical protein
MLRVEIKNKIKFKKTLKAKEIAIKKIRVKIDRYRNWSTQSIFRMASINF